MDFWKNFLDLSKDRKIKGFILATILLILKFIDGATWAMTFAIFVGGNAYDKVIEKKIEQ